MRMELKTDRVQFMTTKPAVPKPDGRGGQKVDRDSHEPLWVIELVAMDDTGAEVIKVTVSAAQPPRLVVGQPVQVTSLVAVMWAIDDKHGVAFRAAAITPAKQSATA